MQVASGSGRQGEGRHQGQIGDSRAIEIESTHIIEIDSFVPRSAIDQRFFDIPYWISVYKLIGVILAAVPIVLFLKAIMGQSRKRSQAVSDFKKHMDYVFWVIMLLVGCGVIYSLGKLLYEFAR